MYISASVGQNGKNKKAEVAFIQSLLALLSEEDLRMPVIVSDGICGKNTIAAIGKFQKLYVKLQTPDCRVDPNGRSEKTLIAKSLEIDKCYLEELAKKHGLKKVDGSVHQKGPRTISYRENAKKVLSPYSENVIKLAMTYAGVNRCDISSTI